MGYNIKTRDSFIIPKKSKHFKLLTNVENSQDVDVFALLVNNETEIYETICFQNRKTHGIIMDEETNNILINLNEVKENFNGLILGISIFDSEKDLFNLGNIDVYLQDEDTNKEIFHYHIRNKKHQFNAMHLINIEKFQNNQWFFHCIDNSMIGSIGSIREQFKHNQDLTNWFQS